MSADRFTHAFARAALAALLAMPGMAAGAEDQIAVQPPGQGLVAILAMLLVPLGILILSLALPLGVLITRDNVRARRREIITSLEKFFRRAVEPPHGSGSETWQIIPSFEFVKSKYFHETQERGGQDVSLSFFSVPVGIFIALCFILFYFAFAVSTPACFAASAAERRAAGCWPADFTVVHSLFLLGGEAPGNHAATLERGATIAVLAFLGAYIASLRLFLRSVANFDLTPLTFFRAIQWIIAAVLTSVVLWRAGTLLGDISFHLWLAIAFVIGLYPALGERLLSKFWRYGMLKQTDERALARSKIIPLELIDGIDADIRARLEDHNLYDVQNLATANPIILFVESPFGIYQSIDWVAQAQLATAVGVGRFLTLRELGIRTIFDLERALGPHNTDAPCLKARLARILLPDSEAGNPATSEADLIAAAERLCTIMVDDLAILRLRQIWYAIWRRFGDWRAFDQWVQQPGGGSPAPTGGSPRLVGDSPPPSAPQQQAAE